MNNCIFGLAGVTRGNMVYRQIKALMGALAAVGILLAAQTAPASTSHCNQLRQVIPACAFTYYPGENEVNPLIEVVTPFNVADKPPSTVAPI